MIRDNADVRMELDAANSKLESPFRNPAYMIALGAALGIIAVGIIHR